MTNRMVYQGPVITPGGPTVPVSVWTLTTPGSVAILNADNSPMMRLDAWSASYDANGFLLIAGNGPDGPVTFRAAVARQNQGMFTRYAAHREGIEVMKTGVVTQHTHGVTLRANDGTETEYPAGVLVAESTGYTLYPWDYPVHPAVVLTKAKGCGCGR